MNTEPSFRAYETQKPAHLKLKKKRREACKGGNKSASVVTERNYRKEINRKKGSGIYNERKQLTRTKHTSSCSEADNNKKKDEISASALLKVMS